MHRSRAGTGSYLFVAVQGRTISDQSLRARRGNDILHSVVDVVLGFIFILGFHQGGPHWDFLWIPSLFLPVSPRWLFCTSSPGRLSFRVSVCVCRIWVRQNRSLHEVRGNGMHPSGFLRVIFRLFCTDTSDEHTCKPGEQRLAFLIEIMARFGVQNAQSSNHGRQVVPYCYYQWDSCIELSLVVSASALSDVAVIETHLDGLVREMVPDRTPPYFPIL